MGRAFNFFLMIAANGIKALVVALIFYLVSAVIFWLVMIPASIIGGEAVATTIECFVHDYVGYRVIYVIVFILMVLDDLGFPNFKTLIKRWWKKKKKSN